MDVLSKQILLDKKTKLKPTYFYYFAYDTLYLPLNLGGLHWVLLIIKPNDLKVFYLDSLFGTDTSKINQITNGIIYIYD